MRLPHTCISASRNSRNEPRPRSRLADGEAMKLHTVDILEPERGKYDEIWGVPEYHDFSPGLENVQRFMDVIEPHRGESLIDFGCGTGKAGLEFEARGLDVWWQDLTDSALDENVKRWRFERSAIFDRDYMRWDYGFCCDVLEHIPTEFTMASIARIVRDCRTSWLQISFEPDNFGSLIGQPLHLTVQPFEWWRDRIALFGNLIDARDLCGVGLFVVKR